MEENVIKTEFLLPENVFNEIVSIAHEDRKDKSELLLEMFRVYKKSREILLHGKLLQYGAMKAREMGINSEDDVVKLIREYRNDQSSA